MQEKEEMIKRFNKIIHNLGEKLFSQNCNIKQFVTFIEGLDVEQHLKFIQVVNESLLLSKILQRSYSAPINQVGSKIGA